MVLLPETFHYREIPRKPPLKPVKLPTIPVTLASDKGQIKIVAMVDSGSDFTIVPKSIADILKIDLTQSATEKVIGIGGRVDSSLSDVTLSVKYEYQTISIIIRILVVDTDDIPLLIGRKGFFDRFEVTVNEREQIVKIKDLGKIDS